MTDPTSTLAPVNPFYAARTRSPLRPRVYAKLPLAPMRDPIPQPRDRRTRRSRRRTSLIGIPFVAGKQLDADCVVFRITVAGDAVSYHFRHPKIVACLKRMTFQVHGHGIAELRERGCYDA